MALANCLSMTGVIVVTMGTVLGIIGMATSNWFTILVDKDFERPDDVTWPMDWNNVSFTTCSGSYGLWQICCTGEPCALRAVDPYMQTMRIVLIVVLAILVVSVIGLLVFMFSEGLQESRGARQCISWFVASGCIGFILVTLSILLYEFSHGFFATFQPWRATESARPTGWPHSVTLDWSFFVTAVGALISPIGIFMICTQWHNSDDEESGVGKVNYDKKERTDGSVMDTHI